MPVGAGFRGSGAADGYDFRNPAGRGGWVPQQDCYWTPDGAHFPGTAWSSLKRSWLTSLSAASFWFRIEFTPDQADPPTYQECLMDTSVSRMQLNHQDAGGGVGRFKIYVNNHGPWYVTIPAGLWLQSAPNVVVLSCGHQNLNVWLNGVQIANSVAANLVQRSSGDVYLGGSYIGSNPYYGRCAGFLANDGELSDDEGEQLSDPTGSGGEAEALDPLKARVVLPCRSVYGAGSGGDPRRTPIVGTISKRVEVLLGSDGLTAAEFPKLLKPKGFELDGGDSITIPDDDDLSFGDGLVDSPFSLAFLVKPTTWTGIGLIQKRVSAGDYEYQIHESGGNLIIFLTDTSTGAYIGRTYSITNLPIAGLVYTLIWTYDGSGTPEGISFYVDGKAVTLSSISYQVYTAMEPNTAPVLIGAADGGAAKLSGKLYEAWITPFGLTSRQARRLHSDLRARAKVPA